MMLNNTNQILSTLHQVVGYILISDFVLMIYLIFTQHPKFFIGGLLGKIFLIYIHFLCSKAVKYGRFENRLASIFFTIFLFNVFPVGQVLAVIMLYYSIFKWEKPVTFEVPKPNIDTA